MYESDDTVYVGSGSSQQQETSSSNNDEQQSGKKDNSGVWKAVAIGGIAGIAIGGTALYASTLGDEAAPDDLAADDIASGNTAAGAAPEAATGHLDGMSFGEAFAAARAEVGPGGVFSWHGSDYSTYTAEEWNGMSSSQRSTFMESYHQGSFHASGASGAAHVQEPLEVRAAEPVDVIVPHHASAGSAPVNNVYNVTNNNIVTNNEVNVVGEGNAVNVGGDTNVSDSHDNNSMTASGGSSIASDGSIASSEGIGNTHDYSHHDQTVTNIDQSSHDVNNIDQSSHDFTNIENNPVVTSVDQNQTSVSQIGGDYVDFDGPSDVPEIDTNMLAESQLDPSVMEDPSALGMDDYDLGIQPDNVDMC